MLFSVVLEIVVPPLPLRTAYSVVVVAIVVALLRAAAANKGDIHRRICSKRPLESFQSVSASHVLQWDVLVVILFSKKGRHFHQESKRGTAECGIELTLSSVLSSLKLTVLFSFKLTLSSTFSVAVLLEKLVAFQVTSFSDKVVVRAEMRSEMLICMVGSSERPEPSRSS